MVQFLGSRDADCMGVFCSLVIAQATLDLTISATNSVGRMLMKGRHVREEALPHHVVCPGRLPMPAASCPAVPPTTVTLSLPWPPTGLLPSSHELEEPLTANIVALLRPSR